MSRIAKFSFAAILILASLACGLISGPLNQAQDLAGTAQAMASSMPVSTLQAMSSAMPDITKMFNPTGKPVSTWSGIPIMPQATAGEEFSATSYSYKVPVAAADVQTFYDQQLKAAGWTSQFGLSVTSSGGVMVYQKDNVVVTFTVAQDPNDKNAVVVVIQKSQ
jgi:hypothetical protein